MGGSLTLGSGMVENVEVNEDGSVNLELTDAGVHHMKQVFARLHLGL